jgi:glucokinase
LGASGNPRVLVFDIGGSHISAAVYCGPGSGLGPVKQAPHLGTESSAGFVELLAHLASDLSGGNTELAGAALAVPGPFDYEKGVSWMRHKMPYLYGLSVRCILAERLRLNAAGIRFLNDAAAFLWGEIGAGAARGVSRAVGITLGTGIGSAFAVNGRVVSEGAGVPPGGEIWSVPFEGGIVEDLISTRALKQSYRLLTGMDREVDQIASGAAQDPAATEVFAEFGQDLGRVLRILLRDFSPEVVVLGGGIARSAALFLPALHCELQGLGLQPRVSDLADSAPLLGAGVSWFAHDDNSQLGIGNGKVRAQLG